MGVIERASSLSCSSSPRRKEKSSQKDSHGLLKEKLIRKVNSFSSPSPSRKKEEEKEKDKEKKKLSVSCQKESREVKNVKLIRRASSFSSSLEKEKKKESQEVQKVKKLVRRVSSLSSSSSTSIKKEKPISKEKRVESQKSSSSFKSRIRELGPICKRRKETLAEVPVKIQLEDDDVNISLDRQIEEEGKQNFWLSSGIMSPHDLGFFMSSLDPSLDELVISFLPKSSSEKTPSSSFDQALMKDEGAMKEPISSFWNMDRTGVWVSLINLNGEDSDWISKAGSSEELESNFPSPNSEMVNWDSYSSDVGFTTSSARSTHEDTSHSEWSSSELLSDSMDWELDSEDPIFWPFGKDCDWDDKKLDSFSVSPRKGLCKINFESIKDGSVIPPGSIKLRLRSRKPNSKEALKRRILFVSGLSASKIIEFKKGRGGRNLKSIKRGARFKRRAVPPILENILEEGKSPKETPKKDELSSSDMLSETTDNWDDEMDSDGPIFWPSDQKCAWDSTWDCFNVSPRKGSKVVSPKGGFSIASSVRLRFRPKKKKPKTSDLCASKSFKFKAHKSKVNSSSGKSSKRILVILPSKMASGINKPAEFKPGSSRKRLRAMPSRSVEEIMRLVSVMGKNRKFYEDESNSEELPIEIVMGLDEFDGHEGVDPEFEGESFSLEECMEE